MTSYGKNIALGAMIAFGTSTVAPAAQQSQYQMPMPQITPGMGQTGQMMNNPQMQAQMEQMRAQMREMRQGCERMMTDMRDRRRQSNRR